MPSTRRNVLLALAIVLTGVLAFRLLLGEGGHAPPPHPPLTTGAAPSDAHEDGPGARALTTEAAAAMSSSSEPRYAHDELDLLPLGSSRAGGAPPPPGSRYTGTNSAEAAALRVQADAALAAGDPQAAASLARAGLVIDPHSPRLLVVAAVAALQQSDDHLAEAEEFARQAAAASPCYATAHYNLACALARQRRPADCAAALRAAMVWGREQGMDAQLQAKGDSDFDAVRQAPELRGLLTEP